MAECMLRKTADSAIAVEKFSEHMVHISPSTDHSVFRNTKFNVYKISLKSAVLKVSFNK